VSRKSVSRKGASRDSNRIDRHGVKIALSRTRYCPARGSLYSVALVALVVYSFPCMRGPLRAIVRRYLDIVCSSFAADDRPFDGLRREVAAVCLSF